MPQGFGVRLFVACCNNSCAKQAVSNAVACTTPGYTVIDDVCVHGPILPDLANLYPSVSFENGKSCLDCRNTLHAEKAGKGLVGDDNGVVVPDPSRQQVHHCRRFGSFRDEGCPSLMRSPLCLNPVSSCAAVLWDYLLHCLPLARFLAIFANVLVIIVDYFYQFNGDFYRQTGYP